MSRQIKFRVWDGESYLPSSDGLSFKPKFLLKGEWGVHGFLQRPEMGFVVQQFTGLLDKNNKEIFEGDIVEFYSGYPNQNDNSFYKSKAEVKFENGAFWPRPILEHNDDDTWYNYELKDLKVIGNIFENPELLK